MKFIAPTDTRWLSTLDAIGEELVSDSLVCRYNVEASPDGLEGEEGTFSIWTYWYVEALAPAGRLEEARLAFEKMLTYANHLGLYAAVRSASALVVACPPTISLEVSSRRGTLRGSRSC